MERISQRFKKVRLQKDTETGEVRQASFTVVKSFYEDNKELFGTEEQPTFFTVSKEGDGLYFASGALPQKMPKARKFDQI